MIKKKFKTDPIYLSISFNLKLLKTIAKFRKE